MSSELGPFGKLQDVRYTYTCMSIFLLDLEGREVKKVKDWHTGNKYYWYTSEPNKEDKNQILGMDPPLPSYGTRTEYS